MSGVRAVLFDLDGTLLDTKDEWVRAFNEALASVGRPPLPADAVAAQIGTPFETILASIGVGPDDGARVTATFVRLEHEAIRRGVRAFPGIREMLDGLRDRPLATVTNKATDSAREALRVAGLEDRFRAIVGGDATPRKKPAPDPMLRAAEVLQVPPDACLVVGDTENDVRAGRAAGARTVGVTWGYGSRRALEEARAHFLIEAPAALPPLVRALTPNTGP